VTYPLSSFPNPHGLAGRPSRRFELGLDSQDDPATLPQKDFDSRGPALVMREVFSSLGRNRDTNDDFGGNRRRYHRGSLHTSSSLRSVPILAAGYYVYGLDAESTFDLFLPHFFSLFLSIPAGP